MQDSGKNIVNIQHEERSHPVSCGATPFEWIDPDNADYTHRAADSYIIFSF